MNRLIIRAHAILGVLVIWFMAIVSSVGANDHCSNKKSTEGNAVVQTVSGSIKVINEHGEINIVPMNKFGVTLMSALGRSNVKIYEQDDKSRIVADGRFVAVTRVAFGGIHKTYFPMALVRLGGLGTMELANGDEVQIIRGELPFGSTSVAGVSRPAPEGRIRVIFSGLGGETSTEVFDSSSSDSLDLAAVLFNAGHRNIPSQAIALAIIRRNSLGGSVIGDSAQVDFVLPLSPSTWKMPLGTDGENVQVLDGEQIELVFVPDIPLAKQSIEVYNLRRQTQRVEDSSKGRPARPRRGGSSRMRSLFNLYPERVPIF